MASRNAERISAAPAVKADDPGGSTEDVKPDGAQKKRKFRPFKAVRRLFTIKRRSLYPSDGAVVASYKAKSSTEIAASSNSDVSEPDSGPGLPSKAFSMSADSVFPSNQQVELRHGLDISDLQSMKSTAVSIPNLHHSFQNELFTKLKTRIVSVDDGLPQSPTSSTPPINSCDVIMGEPLKRDAVSFESEKSLYSVNSSELDDDYSTSPHSLTAFPKQRISTSSLDSNTEYDLDAVPLSESLDLSTAHYKASVRPKARRAPSARKISQKKAALSLSVVSEESLSRRQPETANTPTAAITPTAANTPTAAVTPKAGAVTTATAKPTNFNRPFPEQSKFEPSRRSPSQSPVKVVVITPKTTELATFEIKQIAKVEIGETKISPDSVVKPAPVVTTGNVANRSKLFSQKSIEDASKSSENFAKPLWRKRTDTVPDDVAKRENITMRTDKTDTEKSKRMSAHGYPVQHEAKVNVVNKRFSTISADDNDQPPPWISMARKKQTTEDVRIPEIKTEVVLEVKKIEPEVKKVEPEVNKIEPEVKAAETEVKSTLAKKSLFEQQESKSQSIPAWKQQLLKKEEPKLEPEPDVPAWKRQLNKSRENTSTTVKGPTVSNIEVTAVKPAADDTRKPTEPTKPKKVMDLMKNFQKVEVS